MHHATRALALLLVPAALLGAGLLLLPSDPLGSPTADGAGLPQAGGTPGPLVHADAAHARVRLAAGPYAAPVGRRLELDVAGRAATRLRRTASEEAAGRLDLDLRGRIRIDVADRRGDAMLLRVGFGSLAVVCTAGGAARAPAAIGTGEPFWVRATTDGTVTGYRFPDAFDGEARRWARTLVAAHLVTVANDAAGTWIANEADATAQAEVRYRLVAAEPFTVERHKVAYAATDSGSRGLLPRVDGRGRAEFAGDAGWIARSAWRERQDLDVAEASASVHVELAVETQLAAWSDDGEPALAGAWDAAWAPASGASDRAPAASPAPAHDVRGADLQQVLGDVAAALAAGAPGSRRSELRELLAMLLRERPEAIAALAGVLARRELPAPAAGFAITALGLADTSESRGLLARLARDAHLDLDLRARAVRAFAQADAPTAADVAALNAIVHEPDGNAALVGAGLQVLGAFARRRPEDGDGTARLLALGELAQRRGLVAHWLDALGNAGGPGVERAVLAHTSAPEASIRSAAVAALRDVRTGTATQALVRATTDPSDRVRVEAAVALVERRAEPGVRATLTRLLAEDASVRLRRVTLEALAAHAAGDASVRELLAASARGDRSPELRALAARALGR